MIEPRRERQNCREIGLRLNLASNAVARHLAKAGYARLPELEPAPPIVRSEHLNHGELLHLDIEKLGRA